MSAQQNYLVPVDFRGESQTALEYAHLVGRKTNATLHLLFILEEETPLLKMVLKDEQRDMIHRGASDKLDELAGKILSPGGTAFTTQIKQGKIYQEIINTAKEVNADLIFMGRTDSSDMVKNFTGTNTMHIIRESEVPVITIRNRPVYFGCEHIILPLDLTKQSIVKASNAVALARMLDARITVLSILQESSKAQEIKFITRLDEIRNTIEQLNIECGIKLVIEKSGSFDHLLNQAVKDLQGDLVMIMTQQEMNITDFFVGSAAQQIINRSEFPVLSINPLAPEINIIPDPLVNVFLNPVQIFDR
jgi:nucleotide-binding universal stress UspA family protein